MIWFLGMECGACSARIWRSDGLWRRGADASVLYLLSTSVHVGIALLSCCVDGRHLLVVHSA